MRLNKANLSSINSIDNITSKSYTIPTPRVLQFGTGVLLRGLPAYCIDKANQEGNFNGGIIMVKSTKHGDIKSFKEQDCLYTLRTIGVRNNKKIESQQIVSSIVDVIDANESWHNILELSKDPNINIILSNTTEKGIIEMEDSIFESPPHSFPGKITTYLYHRYQYLGDHLSSRIIILPTELIDDNAKKLKDIVLKIAQKHRLAASFLNWLNTHVYFCNTLVDRIVPGSYEDPSSPYVDVLKIAAEPYFLWAIESTDTYVKQQLSFANSSKYTPILSSINTIKEVKIRILNGTHTLLAALAILSGHKYVKDSLEVKSFEQFVRNLINKEITPCLEAQKIDKGQIKIFSESLIDRFKNPYIDHSWTNIAQNYHEKIKNRILPLLTCWYSFQSTPPIHISLGFSAYLFFIKQQYVDTEAEVSCIIRQANDDNIMGLLSDVSLWGIDLTQFDGWVQSVQGHYNQLIHSPIETIIENL